MRRQAASVELEHVDEQRANLLALFSRLVVPTSALRHCKIYKFDTWKRLAALAFGYIAAPKIAFTLMVVQQDGP